MTTKKIGALLAAVASALALSSCGSATTNYMNTEWDAGTNEEKGLACMLFRAEPDEELGIGDEFVVRAIVESAAAEGTELDAEDVHKFLDDECPSKAEIEDRAG